MRRAFASTKPAAPSTRRTFSSPRRAAPSLRRSAASLRRRRIYSVAIKRDAADAIALARKILAGKLSTEFSLRDVYRAGWIGLSDRDAVERAIQLLCDLDWLAETVEPTLGRSRKRFRVNPRIGKAPGKSHGAERSE